MKNDSFISGPLFFHWEFEGKDSDSTSGKINVLSKCFAADVTEKDH